MNGYESNKGIMQIFIARRRTFRRFSHPLSLRELSLNALSTFKPLEDGFLVSTVRSPNQMFQF